MMADGREPAPGERENGPPPGGPNRWTPDLEAAARRTMNQASGYAWMYDQMVVRAKKWGGVLSSVAGVLGGLVGTEGLVSAFASDSGAPPWVGVATAVVGYLIVVALTLDKKTWRLDDVRAESLAAQVSFAQLSRGVMLQLALAPSDRQDAGEFVKGILNEIETMKLSSPTIDLRVRRAYASKFIGISADDFAELMVDSEYVFREGSEDDSSDSGDEPPPADTRALAKMLEDYEASCAPPDE